MLIHEVNERNYLTEREKKELVDYKFTEFDKLRDIKSDSELKEKLSLAFRDPTVWAYATLKDKQEGRLKLYYYQDILINEKTRFVNITAANQIGKTFAMCIKAAHHAIFVPNAQVMIVSKSEQQAAYILDEIKWMLKTSRIDYSEIVGEIENRTELQINGVNDSFSIIRCFAPTTSALGFPASLLICDEVNFWPKINDLTPVDYYDQVLEPRTNFMKNLTHPFLTMGQIVFISNPNGQHGIGYRAFNEARFANYKYNWLSNPGNTLEEYNQVKNRLPYYRFCSIYAAEFVSADGAFITSEQFNSFSKWNVEQIIPKGAGLYLGGDFAGEDVRSRSRDKNILYGLIKEGNILKVVYMREWPSGTKKSEIYEEIKRLHSHLTIVKFCYDKVGVGDKVKNDLIDGQILTEGQIESLTFSLQNKSDVYINMQRFFETGSILGADYPELRVQLLGLKVEQQTGSPHLKIHHATEGLHDDHPDALACAVWGAKETGQVSFHWIKEKVIKIGDEGKCKHYKLEPTKEKGLRCSLCGEER